MEYTFEQSQQKKVFPKKIIIFGLIGFVIFIGLIVLGLYFFHQLQVSNMVSSALKDIPSAMDKAKGDNGYPVNLPSTIASTSKVHIEGGGSFDGTVYCITGTSIATPSINYYSDSSSKQPQKGSCQSAANLPAPVVITNIQKDIVSAGQIGLSWTPATYAVSYTLQCATNDTFSDNLVQTTDASVARTCDNLIAGTKYFARVRGNNAKGPGDWSAVLSITSSTISTAPAGLTINPVSSTKINYSFASVGGAQRYIIEWATDINFMKNLKTISQIGLSGTASGLTPNTSYYFHVKAVTSGFDAAHATFSQEEYTSTPA
jgi:hypothetical protein